MRGKAEKNCECLGNVLKFTEKQVFRSAVHFYLGRFYVSSFLSVNVLGIVRTGAVYDPLSAFDDCFVVDE